MQDGDDVLETQKKRKTFAGLSTDDHLRTLQLSKGFKVLYICLTSLKVYKKDVQQQNANTSPQFVALNVRFISVWWLTETVLRNTIKNRLS